MKKPILLWLLATTVAGSADVFAYSFTAAGLPAAIPDNNATGYQNSLTVNGVSGPITDVAVTLNITGGFNGDLYVALDYNNSSAVLLNRVGLSSMNSVGYSDSGFNLTLDNSASNDVHFYQTVSYSLNSSGQLTGEWQPDGRLVSPLGSGSTIAESPRANMLDVFDGMNANGTWTLFAADLSPGGVSTLTGWSLTLTVAPEPSALALMSCAGLGCILKPKLARRRRTN